MIASDPSICSRARASIFTARRSSGCQRVEREREIRSGFAGLAIAGAFAGDFADSRAVSSDTPSYDVQRNTPDCGERAEENERGVHRNARFC